MNPATQNLPPIRPFVVSEKKSSRDLCTLFGQYIAECQYTRRRRPATIRGYKAVFDTFVKLCPDVSLNSLTTETMTRFFAVVQKRERIIGKGTI